MSLRVAIYARVSTDDQTVDNQIDELAAAAGRKGWEVVRIFADRGISGTKGRDKRPEFDKLHKGIARHDFDLVAAWSVDRLGRSTVDLIGFLGELRSSGVDLYLDKQGLDTTTPAGRAMFQMLGVFAEFEAAIIKERVRAGVARAKKRGTKSGKPFGRPKVAPEREAACRAALASMGVNRAARASGVGTSVALRIQREIKAEKLAA